MTVPTERTSAVIKAKQFLYDLMDPKKTPRVPKAIRERALRILKHYPSEYDLDRAASLSSDIFGKTE